MVSRLSSLKKEEVVGLLYVRSENVFSIGSGFAAKNPAQGLEHKKSEGV